MDVIQSDALIEYFFICGLNCNVGLDDYSRPNDEDDKKMFNCIHPLERSYKSSILQKFPDNRVTLSGINDESIISLCMPDGLRLFTSSTVNSHPINHNFIITQEDGSRIYGTSLQFVEEIDNNDIKHAVTDLQTLYRLGHQGYDSRQLCCSNCENVNQDGSDKFWCEDDKLYTIKSIGVLSQHSYIHCHQSWLFDIWLMVQNQNRLKPDLNTKDIILDLDSIIEIESYIYNMLYEVHTPDRGKTVAIDGPSMTHYCRCPDANELPAFELPIRGLLEVLGLENFIRVYSCVLLEYRVVIMSQDDRLLMLVAECITTLLFPFIWSHVYAPILPLAARDFLNAPVPFIMGIKLGAKEEEETIELTSDASVCYVNIDQQTVTSSDEIPTFPYELDLRREITEILVHAINSNYSPHTGHQSRTPNPNSDVRKTDANNLHDSKSGDDLLDISLSSNGVRKEREQDSKDSVSSLHLPREAGISIFDLIKPILKVEKRLDKSEMMAKKYCDMLKSNKVFRELFFNHFLHIFHDYEQFIIPPKANTDVSEYYMDHESNVQVFDKAGFLSEQPETHLPFLSAFLETQMFTSFIDMKIVSAWEAAHPNLLLFERNLRKMQQRIKNQLNISHHGDINFKPYFKSDKLIEDTDKEFEGYLVIMTNSSPSIFVKNESSNGIHTGSSLQHDSNSSTNDYPTNGKSIIGKSHKVCVGTDFPMLHGDRLRVEPCRKSSMTNSEIKVHSPSQDLEFNDLQSLSGGDGNVSKQEKHILSQTRTLGRDGDVIFNKKTRERFDPRPHLSNIVPGMMSQSHATFVKTLLQESKAKTKRMVLEKMGGQEAVELEHGDRFVSGIEENTLVACLCDLLERMWCHGLIGSHCKSTIWTHLIKYAERDKEVCIVKQTNKDKSKNKIIPGTPQSRNDLVKDALISLGVHPYCLFRYFNGELNKPDTMISLRNVKDETEFRDKDRSITPEFLLKALGQTKKDESDNFFNWDSQIPGPVIRNSSGGSSKQLSISNIFGSQSRSLVSDIEAIQSMTDIKTDVGFARAFVRLALEKKLLRDHLKKLLSDTKLLREIYNRYAFLRSEPECEQFLFYLLALQAVDYYSFTNLYIHSKLIYRMYIHRGQRFSPGNSTSANAWFCINGQHSSTGVISIPKDENRFDFQNQNLGILTSMKIGHDNSGLSPRWFIEFVLIQNKITGEVYKFPCGHWLDKYSDDGSTERLLIGEILRMDEDEINGDNQPSDTNNSLLESETSLSRRQSSGKIVYTVPVIQEQLGDAVNKLVKYFCRQQDREKISVNSISGSCNVTVLLCGEGGLVCSVEQVFMYGFRSSGFFQRKLFVWDYLEKVSGELEHDLQCRGSCMTKSGNGKCSAEWSSLVSDCRIVSIQQFCKLINQISKSNQCIGKDGKFQRFVCVCVRDHMFPELIQLLGLTDCTKHFYAESSFFRDSSLREVLIKVLSSLGEFIIPLEPALIDNV